MAYNSKNLKTDLQWKPIPQYFDSSVDDFIPATGSADGMDVNAKVADGANVTIGAKADAAVTNPASSGSVIALLKGVITKLANLMSVKIKDSTDTNTLAIESDGSINTNATVIGSLPAFAATPDINIAGVTPDGDGKIPVVATINVGAVTASDSDPTVANPVVGTKTVTATAAEIFAGASVKASRKRLRIRNEDSALRARIGPSTVTQQAGAIVEPGAVVEITFDPATAIAIYAISEGVSLQMSVWED